MSLHTLTKSLVFVYAFMPSVKALWDECINKRIANKYGLLLWRSSLSIRQSP